MLSIVRTRRRTMPRLEVTTAAGDRIRPRRKEADRIDYVMPADARVTVVWNDRSKKDRP